MKNNGWRFTESLKSLTKNLFGSYEFQNRFQKNGEGFQRKPSLHYFDMRTQNLKYLKITIISSFVSIYFCSFSSVRGFCTSFVNPQNLRTCGSWCACTGEIRHAEFV